MKRIRLQSRDHQILEAVTCRVRMLTVSQVAETWWSGRRDPNRQARSRLDALCANELLHRHNVYALPMQPLATPLLVWRPDQPLPTGELLGSIAYHLQTRWPHDPPKRTAVITATRRLANRIGGFAGGVSYAEQVTHDLHVTQLYLDLLRREPGRAARWRSEELLKSRQAHGEKLPDAVLVNGNGRMNWAIEFGGRYSKRRLQELVDHCANRGMGIEIW